MDFGNSCHLQNSCVSVFQTINDFNSTIIFKHIINLFFNKTLFHLYVSLSDDKIKLKLSKN